MFAAPPCSSTGRRAGTGSATAPATEAREKGDRMSEPESLATDEALAEPVRRHSYDRLLMLSDGIFAIAITLAALEIQAPPEHASVPIMVHAMTRPIIAYI